MITALLDPVDDLTRRRLLGAGGVAAGLLLAGCATGTPAGTDTAPDQTWSFTDDRQEAVTLPARPARIVMQEDAAGALLPFGIRPSAVFGNAPLIDSPQFQDQDIAGIEQVGSEFGVINLEKLAALDPDIIVVPWSSESPDDVTWMGFADEAQFEFARQIAPIVAISVTHRPYSQMIERFTVLAGALGADLEAPQVVAMRRDFDAAREGLRAAAAAAQGLLLMAASPSEELVYVSSPGPDSEVAEYEALGLTFLSVGEPGFSEISWETIGAQPADVILLDARNFGEGVEFLDTHPIWPTLPAVQADQVGNWFVGTMYRMPFFTRQLRELTALIERSRDVVGEAAQ